MQYEGDMYLLRLSVSDRVNSGLIEKLVQDMRQKQIPKGIAIVSTEFTPDAKKSARGRQNIVLIDGQTLFDIGEH
jgi:restriction endonuclease Mrr